MPYKLFLNQTRSKLHKLNMSATKTYFFKALFITEGKKLILPRIAPISQMYKHLQAYTPQGRVNVRIPLSRYKVGLKFGMFAATKKPFNYRPKIKKQKR